MRKAVPKLSIEDYHTVFDFILDFYRKLGWDPKRHELDPYKIKMHPETWQQICSDILETWGLEGSMAWMNYGPSGDEGEHYGLEPNQLEIGDGAIIDIGRRQMG